MSKLTRLAKRCLVAGGAGFIGSNLTRQLLRDGHMVDVADNLSTGRYENIRELTSLQRFRFLELDVANAADVSKLSRPYDVVYHLACPTGVPNIAILGQEMLAACSAGTQNLLEIATASKATFLYASSAEAYGDPQISPQHETYVGSVDPVGPRSPYEIGKQFGETLTRYWGSKNNLETRIVRIFNTYGPRMSLHDQRVIPQIMGSLIAGRPVKVFGDGEQTRTFLYVDDLVRALNLVVDKGSAGEVYNIGGNREIGINDLVSLLSKATGLPARISHKPHFISDHRGRCPDTAKIRQLGWRPKVTLERGAMEYFATLKPKRQPAAKREPGIGEGRVSA